MGLCTHLPQHNDCVHILLWLLDDIVVLLMYNICVDSTVGLLQVLAHTCRSMRVCPLLFVALRPQPTARLVAAGGTDQDCAAQCCTWHISVSAVSAVGLLWVLAHTCHNIRVDILL